MGTLKKGALVPCMPLRQFSGLWFRLSAGSWDLGAPKKGTMVPLHAAEAVFRALVPALNGSLGSEQAQKSAQWCLVCRRGSFQGTGPQISAGPLDLGTPKKCAMVPCMPLRQFSGLWFRLSAGSWDLGAPKKGTMVPLHAAEAVFRALVPALNGSLGSEQAQKSAQWCLVCRRGSFQGTGPQISAGPLDLGTPKKCAMVPCMPLRQFSGLWFRLSAGSWDLGAPKKGTMVPLYAAEAVFRALVPALSGFWELGTLESFVTLA